MRYYTVHAPPDGEPERFVFVKDGFSWPALVLPVLWVLYHRMWLTLVWYVVFVLVVAWAGRLGGENLATLLAILGGLLFAFEANDIRRRSLRHRGYSDAGAASGRNYAEAEARFFAAAGERSAAVPRRGAMARAAYTPAARERGADEPILGLFPEPER
jgi:hypothetical protein